MPQEPKTTDNGNMARAQGSALLSDLRGSVVFDPAMELGVYALAYQFVRPSTGQTAAMRLLVTVEVG